MTLDHGSQPPEADRQGRRRFGALALVLVLFAGAALGVIVPRLFRNHTTDATAEDTTGDRTPPKLPPGVVDVDETAQRNAGLQVVAVETVTLPTMVTVTGLVAPEDSRVVHIRPLARGLIEEVSVSLGTRVAAGQPLVTLDNIELGELIGTYLSEKAALVQARSDLEVKRQVLERSEALIKLEAIAQQTLELRRAEFRNTDAAVASQRARVAKVEEQIHRFGLSDPDLAKLTPEEGGSGHRVASHNVLRAPFEGVVTKYEVAKGEVVQPNEELMTVTNLSTVWVLADVYEKDLGRVQQNAEVSVKVDTYPDRTFVGRLTYISDLIDPKTRTAKVRCVVRNDDGALKLDMFARIAIPTNDRRQSIGVPQAAIQQIEHQSVLFVRRSPTRFERRDVQVGAAAGDLVEIVAGLKPGEQVVTSGSFYFKTALLRERIGEQ